ncbi:MAG: STAS domain-containing protein [Ignavibacteria bacterium]|jgi:anti-anti-sigma factor|nr:STAS domain-containing protein [Ignavibacteria bacterium]MDH7528523.1 STAS domain-containing protein [Ignavibacteria bacterium]NPV11276.1 STAS domain-containing protein [Ignavibacteria bacterium]
MNNNNVITIEKSERYCIVKISGEIVSLSTSIKLKEILKELIDVEKFYQILLDLSDLKFIESSLIGVIVETYRSLIMINGKMNLVVKSQSVYERFEVSQLDKLLRIYNNIDEAKKSFF